MFDPNAFASNPAAPTPTGGFNPDAFAQNAIQSTPAPTPITDLTQPAATNTFASKYLPNLGSIDQSLSNMPGLLGGAGSGIYNVGKGLLNLGKDAVVDTFNTINHPITALQNAPSNLKKIFSPSTPTDQMDSVGNLLNSTLGGRGAAGFGNQLGLGLAKLTGKQTADQFDAGKLAGTGLNTALAAANAVTDGGAGAVAHGTLKVLGPALESLVAKGMSKGLATSLITHAAQYLTAGATGAGFQVGGNLQENAPVLENTSQAFFTGGAAPLVIGAASKVTGKTIGLTQGLSSDSSFDQAIIKAFAPNKKEFKLGDKFTNDARTALTDIVNNKDSIGITNENGDIKPASKYNFSDTLEAQKSRMPEVYKAYTASLEGVDKTAFETTIKDAVGNKVGDLDARIAKENSTPDRNAMIGLKTELESLRDTSPIGMQDYLQKLGARTKAVGGVMTPEQIQTANLAGTIKAALDKAVTTSGGSGYSAERGIYAAHKTVQDAFVRGALKEAKATPGLVDKLTNLGVTAEGLQFILTHDPHSLVIAAGLKATSSFTKWLNSPQRALGNLYKALEKNPQPAARSIPLSTPKPKTLALPPGK